MINAPPAPDAATSAAAPTTPPAPPRIWTVFAGLGSALFVGLILQIGCFFWLASLELERPGHTCDSIPTCVDSVARHPSDFGTTLTLALMAFIWIAFSLLGALFGSAPVADRLELRPCRRLAATSGALLLGMLSIAYGGIAVSRLAGAKPGPVLKLLSGMVESASPHGWGLAVWVGLAVAGISEELFFRGFMQARLQRRWSGWGIVVAAAAFGAMHWDWTHSPITFAEGLLLGVVARRCRSILPGIGAHALQNLTSIAISPQILDAFGGNLGYLLLALALVGLGTSWLTLDRLQPARRPHGGGGLPAAEPSS